MDVCFLFFLCEAGDDAADKGEELFTSMTGGGVGLWDADVDGDVSVDVVSKGVGERDTTKKRTKI